MRAELYAQLVKCGIKTLDDVPKDIQEAVKLILSKKWAIKLFFLYKKLKEGSE